MLGQQIEVGFLAGNPTFFIAYVLCQGSKKYTFYRAAR